MKERAAIEMLVHLERWAQKARSNIRELMERDMKGESQEAIEFVLEDLNPWLFGKGSIVVPLDKLNGRVRNGQALTPGDFYNMMIVVAKTPVLGLSPIAFNMGWEFPEPTLAIFTEWEPIKREGELEVDDEYDPLTDPGYMMGLLAQRRKERGDE